MFDVVKEISNNTMQSSCEADGLAIPAQDCTARGGKSFTACRAPVEWSLPLSVGHWSAAKPPSELVAVGEKGSGSFANHLSSSLVSDKYTFPC